MTTYHLKSKYDGKGNVMKGKVKRIQFDKWGGDKSWTWGVEWENGQQDSLGMVASGRDSFRKKDFEVVFNSNN